MIGPCLHEWALLARSGARAGLLLAALTGARTGRAQVGPVPPPAPAPTAAPQGFTRYNMLRGEDDFGFLHADSLRTDSFDPLKYIPLGRKPGYYLTFGADVRYQYEIANHSSWGAGRPGFDDEDGYLLQRHMLHTDWHLGPHLRVFGQLQSNNVQGRTDGPRPEIDRDELDLYQAYADLTVPLGPQAKAVLRVGRQEFNYGSGRLLTMREGPNTRQSFGAARLALTRPGWRVDILTARPIVTKPGIFDNADDPDQLLWGAYAARAVARLRGGYDFYYFGLRKNNALFLQGRGRELRHTAGVRLWSQPAPFGYDFELTGQLGTFGPGRIRAYYASFVVYYQLPQLPLTPTLRYATNVLSGDRDRNNPDLQTFNALYPRPYFGAATTPIGPGNLVDVHPGVELHFGKTMTLLADVDWLWRYSAEDAIYTPNLIPVIPSPGAPGPPLSERRFIGRQFNLEYFWQASRHFSAGFAYAWMPAGAFLRDQTPGRTLTYYRSTVLYQF